MQITQIQFKSFIGCFRLSTLIKWLHFTFCILLFWFIITVSLFFLVAVTKRIRRKGLWLVRFEGLLDFLIEKRVLHLFPVTVGFHVATCFRIFNTWVVSEKITWSLSWTTIERSIYWFFFLSRRKTLKLSLNTIQPALLDQPSIRITSIIYNSPLVYRNHHSLLIFAISLDLIIFSLKH